ncbi:MAG TPA: nucleoside hydrolase-like domain-containing protein [Gemmatimonadales bacterium]|nr:nucleoside hydrolase-like domain-containing protein [Gemmatimonadales bacterium]
MTLFRRFTASLLALGLLGGATGAAQVRLPRVVVTTDPELDDANSLIRYLLYSTDFRTEGLIYASSGFHWKGDGTGKKVSVANREYSRWGLNLCPCASWRWSKDEHFIDKAVTTYEQVYPNLRVHNPDYPTPVQLRSKIRWGNVEFDGDISKDSPGSDLIKSLLLDDEPGPVYLLAWGGQSTIARALKSIHDQYAATPEWPAIYQKVSRKAILSTSGDQDDTYATYIEPNWPDIQSLPAGVGGVTLGYGAQSAVSAEDSVYYSAAWTRENITSRGAFGALYRVWGDGKQMVKGDIFDYFGLSGSTVDQLKAKHYIVWTPPHPRGEFLGEGDTFTYLNLIDNGLQGYEDDTPGGWAGRGRTAPSQRAAQLSAINSYDDLLRLQELAAAGRRPPSPDPNFIPAAQKGLAARLLWSVTPTYAAANHEPGVTIQGPARISAHPGETVRLQGVTSDPDSNAVTVRWWQWREVGTYPGQVSFSNPTEPGTSVQVPTDAAAGQTIHLVLEATDDGTPALTRYQRVVINVLAAIPPPAPVPPSGQRQAPRRPLHSAAAGGAAVVRPFSFGTASTPALHAVADTTRAHIVDRLKATGAQIVDRSHRPMRGAELNNFVAARYGIVGVVGIVDSQFVVVARLVSMDGGDSLSQVRLAGPQASAALFGDSIANLFAPTILGRPVTDR